MSKHVKPLRGRVVIRPIIETQIGSLHLPQMHRDWQREADRYAGKKAQSSHRGIVVAMGDPVTHHPSGVDIPPGFEVGDEVFYVWSHNEKEFTKPWGDGSFEVAWVPQMNVLGVVEK
jgi:hypothetical protein